jgi:hypothetical protein
MGWNVAFKEHPRHLGGKIGIHRHRCGIERSRKMFIFRPIEWSFGAIGKNQRSRDTGIFGKVVDALDYGIGSRKFDESTAFND